jgi:predicted nuclease of predicted toxin-antitoxin system
MLFKIDENLHSSAAEAFQARGHDAPTVRDQGMRGFPDSEIASVCQAEGRGIVTLDLDFADPRHYPPGAYAGLIVLRLRDESRGHVLKVLGGLLDVLEKESPKGQLWIVEEYRIRIHGQTPEEGS